METVIGRKRKERIEEENCVKKKKIRQTTMGRKRKERPHTSEEKEEEEDGCRQTKKEKSKIDVSFSKRRKGLFCKAARLCKDFNDTKLAVLVVSQAGRPYAFGHSSVDEVLNGLYHIQPTSTKSAEGLNLMRQQQEQKKLMGLKEEIENELRVCQTVEGFAALREKCLKIDENIKIRLTNCSSKKNSFQGGLIDQKYNIDLINVGNEGSSLRAWHEDSYNNLSRATNGFRLNGDKGGGNLTTGIGGNSFLASSESNYGVHDSGLAINRDIDGCSLGLWHEVGGNSLKYSSTDNSSLVSTTSKYSVNDGNSLWDLTTSMSDNPLCSITDISGNVLLASTTSNYGADGDIRLTGDINGGGCSLGLWHEVGDNPLRDSTKSNAFLALNTSDYGVDDMDFRSYGNIDAEGCSLRLWNDVSDHNPLRDSTTDIIDNVLLASNTSSDGVDGDLGLNVESEGGSTIGSCDLDVSSLPSVCSSTSIGALERVESSSSDFLQSNANKGYYSYWMEGDMGSDPYSYQNLCNFYF